MHTALVFQLVIVVLQGVAFAQTWTLLQTNGLPDKRHEACFVMVNNKGYLIGGRGRKQVSEYDPVTNTWTNKGVPPQGEMHHMQCLAYNGKIWIAGAWYGSYPTESNHEQMFVYNPVTNVWSSREYLPLAPHRRRGGGAFVAHNGKMYLAMGNRGGHGSHSVTLGMLDEYDPVQDLWSTRIFPDAPHARDHTGGGIVNGRLCVASGRNGSASDFFNSPVLPTNCFNFETDTWEIASPIPQGRAGAAVGVNCDGHLMVAGGEGFGMAFKDVDIFDGTKWTKGPSLQQARHGSGFGFASCDSGDIYIASGAGSQGGTYELTTTEQYIPASTPTARGSTLASPTSTSSIALELTSGTATTVQSSTTAFPTTILPISSVGSSTIISTSTSNKPVLQIYTAGQVGAPTALLVSNGSICPSDYPNGFTVACSNVHPSTSAVLFFVNGALVRKEGLAPYTIAGDDLKTSVFYAWKSYPSYGTIRCAPNVGDFIEAANVRFSCP